MNKLYLPLLAALAALPLAIFADSLSFSGGTVTNFSDVTLSLAGPADLVCQVERLNHTNDNWEVQGTITLSSSGTGTFNSTLVEGIYGFYRAQSTNGAYLSTNAYGAVAGYLNQTGYTMIGNPFGAESISAVIASPPEVTTAYKWVNSSSSYTIAYYYSGSWDTDILINELEGVIVELPSDNTNDVRYLFDGLFTTNTISKLLPAGFEIICSQLYHPAVTSTFLVDVLDSTDVDGVSDIPVETPGYDPQCIIYQAADSSLTYITNILDSNTIWTSAGTNTTIYLGLTEGFWIEKPTNATWNVTRTIW